MFGRSKLLMNTRACSNCTRLCGHGLPVYNMTTGQFAKALHSLKGFPGMVGMMGGEPTIHPEFAEFEWRYMNEASSRMAALLTGESVAVPKIADGDPTVTEDSRFLRAGTLVVRGRGLMLACALVRDANEVRAGLECGIKIDDFNGYAAGDVIECYRVEEIKRSL